jgi:hypothetical protein
MRYAAKKPPNLSGMLSEPTATLRVRGTMSPQHEPYTRIDNHIKNRIKADQRDETPLKPLCIIQDNLTISSCPPERDRCALPLIDIHDAGLRYSTPTLCHTSLRM